MNHDSVPTPAGQPTWWPSHVSRLLRTRDAAALLEAARACDSKAFLLTQVAGLSYAEAGEVCGCPIGTIRSRVARAREDLVTALAGRHARSA